MIFRFKWLFPGLRLKRWIFLCIIGGFLSIYAGVKFFVDKSFNLIWSAVFILGVFVLIFGIVLFIRSIIEVFAPRKKGQLLNVVFQKRYLEKGHKVVAIGGGTGLSNLLSGLKNYTHNITAIVTVADEGGSSGRLRKEFDILPPGDIRNCLVALADASGLMRRLFQYRFERGEGFEGHSFGNLFITAMKEVTGNFDVAIKESSKILAIKGQVLPVTLEKIRIKAEYIDGSTVEGEDVIPKKVIPIKKISLSPQGVKANEEAVQSIKSADIIVMGPGSLYTSILPTLLVENITEAIKNSHALKIYICNVMTQYGETDGFTASMHIKALVEHTCPEILDCCILNSAASDSSRLLRYAEQKSFPVIPDSDVIENMGYWVVEDDLISRQDYIRHNPVKLVKKIMETYSYWVRNGKNRAKNINNK